MLEYIKTDPDPFGFKNLHFVVDKEDSIILKEMDEPCVIISSSGMMEAGRIRHHLRTTIEDEKNTILITGFCEPSTIGGKIARKSKQVFIIDRMYEVKAEIVQMREYSAHADYGDLLKFLVCQDKEKIREIFLVHGEKRTMLKFKRKLNQEGYSKVEIADHRISYEV
jgi:metallo-beta-lactamase family protein